MYVIQVTCCTATAHLSNCWRICSTKVVLESVIENSGGRKCSNKYVPQKLC